MNKFEIEKAKLEKMRDTYESNRLRMIALEDELSQKRMAEKENNIASMLEGNFNPETKQGITAKLEASLNTLTVHNSNLLEAINIQSKQILPKIDREVKAERLVSMNNELRTLIESFDTNKLNEVTLAIKQIYDFATVIKRECDFYNYTHPAYNPIAELRFLDNYKSLCNLSVDEFFYFIDKHIATSNNLLAELEDSCKDYLKSGNTIPNF